MQPRFLTPLIHAGTALMAALTVACAPLGIGAAPPAPATNAGAARAPGTFTLAPERARDVREHLSGKIVSDYQRTLISSPNRWGKPDNADPKAAPALGRSLMALGAQLDPDWPAAGIDLRAAPYSIPATDRATNGMALRNAALKYGKKVFVLTQQGRFFGLDPDNPGVGINKVTLTGTFSKTYVSLTADGSTAFCVNDAGVLYAIDVANPVSGAYTTRSRTLTGTPATVQTGVFMDPLATDFASGATTMYLVDNAGGAHRLTWGGTGGDELLTPTRFASTTFTEAAVVPLPTTAPATSATPLSGSGIVKAPPVVLGGVMVVGDRAGNVIKYDYNTATKVAWTVNYGWAIETPCPVDVDDNLAITDIFAAAGAQLFWIKGNTASAPVYTGQYALVENGGTDAIVHANNFSSYVNLAADVVKADSDWEAFSSAFSTVTNSLSLPLTANTPTSLDYDHLTHCGFLTGLPPTIEAFCGKLNTKFYYYYPWNTGIGGTARPTLSATYPLGGASPYQVTTPVQDGECTQSANLLSPSAIEFDDDGSYFVADTNHCQVLFVPANNTAWQRWYPSTAMTTTASTYNWLTGARPDGNTTLTTGRYAASYGQPASSPPQNNFYVFAGSLFPNAPNNDAEWSGRQTSDGDPAGLIRDVGNGVGNVIWTSPAIGANAVSRGTAINRAQGLAVGNLGLYIANRNAFQSGTNDNGQVLFIPRATIPAGTYYGITNPVPGRTYVISNFVDPQGLDVWRHPTDSKRDIVFAPSMNSGATAANSILKFDSANAAPTAAGSTIATGLNDPYDVGLDDSGNLFIAEHGADNLKMIAKAVTTAQGAPATTYNWGTAGVAGTVYTILTGMQEISSVTFAANDPQVPAGQRCLYIAMGGNPTTAIPNRIVRLDQTLYHASVAGPNYGYRNTGMTAAENLAGADAGDGGDGTASGVRLSIPWRARGRYNSSNNTFETYICDRGNNRIRRIVSAAGTANAQGYMSMPFSGTAATALGRPIYNSTLTLFARNTVTGNKGIPNVNLAPSRLKNNAVWNATTVATTPSSFTPLLAPAPDAINGPAFPITPSTTGPWNIMFHTTGDAATPYAGAVYQWRLPSQAIFTSATLPEFQHLRLAMSSPSDGVSYFYPTSTGTITSPNEKSPDFYTGRTSPQTVANYCPRIDFSYGTKAIAPILSPPVIYFKDNNVASNRYVYLMNANALWRYDVTTPAAFISGTNGAQVAFSKSMQGRAAGKGTLYSPTSSFQFNSTPPLVGFNGHIYSLDIWSTAGLLYTYGLNDFDGDLASTASNMYVSGVQVGAANLASTTTDNAGIYLAGDAYITEAYFGLVDGKIYRMDLNASAP